MGRFGDRYFSYIASFGALTQVSYTTPQNLKNALGHLAYVLSGITALPQIRKRTQPEVNHPDDILYPPIA